ncbi:dTDP-glucose 4,6-dehydratase [Prochlorococcus sp. MIT 0604]|uniref:dTDP-glucose 4,6-dehydratase n=1 Tax=Prochlorococcus sp. MIT 0604 TaxID=1501268 RepID=UPI0004F8159B|nr:dTDP-glucose 4,6-dehydratase [Prochlorococcus sp. MIT 0604]AIQ95469.1 dTDP-glucose 4,6-dehydratase [Prochlorococcus sp. MIT 0604]
MDSLFDELIDSESINKNILITGGAGFIGTNLIIKLLKNTNYTIYNLDYVGFGSNYESIKLLDKKYPNYFHLNVDLYNNKLVEEAIEISKPEIIIHLAAESHVDRSIDNPRLFIEKNIIGTFNLLESSFKYWENLPEKRKGRFHFHHVSTDEVYGSLNSTGKFSEKSKYAPNSPYSASKASSDHIVMSWFKTFGLPVTISNCSNNYGPYQFPEKLIPSTIIKALNKESIPIYGEGKNIRDWLFVEDHVDSILMIIFKGKLGFSYCIGGNSELDNLQLVYKLCDMLDEIKPSYISYRELIIFVEDRPGHDKRYALDTSLAKKELNWEPRFNLDQGLLNTVKWYLSNQDWVKNTMERSHYKGVRQGL